MSDFAGRGLSCEICGTPVTRHGDEDPDSWWCPSCRMWRNAVQSGRVQSSGFVVLHLDPNGQAVRVWGPFDSEREADAFGLAHTPVWTIWPLENPDA